MFFPFAAEARPVSYPGGWTVMQKNDHDKNSLHFHYSPTAKESFGYRGEILRESQTQFHALAYTRLLKRWNMPAAQANTYLKVNTGVAEKDEEIKAAASIGFAADYETQRIFFSYENRYLAVDDFDGVDVGGFTQNFRVGIAPYIGGYDDLQTWLMFEVEHSPESEDHYITMPIVRFFYREYMAEIGVSDQKDVLFNWIVRF